MTEIIASEEWWGKRSVTAMQAIVALILSAAALIGIFWNGAVVVHDQNARQDFELNARQVVLEDHKIRLKSLEEFRSAVSADLREVKTDVKWIRHELQTTRSRR